MDCRVKPGTVASRFLELLALEIVEPVITNGFTFCRARRQPSLEFGWRL
jgi:hypothetical protein